MIVHLTMINIYQCAIEQILKQLWLTLKTKEDSYVSNSPLLINTSLYLKQYDLI